MPRNWSAGRVRSRFSGSIGERARPAPSAQGATLLLVEDDPEMREILAAVLCAEGYEVVEAADERDPLESVRDRRLVIAVTGAASSRRQSHWKRDGHVV
jgi:PleD family two-component response regulator